MYIIAKFMLKGIVYVWEMIAIPDMQDTSGKGKSI